MQDPLIYSYTIATNIIKNYNVTGQLKKRSLPDVNFYQKTPLSDGEAFCCVFWALYQILLIGESNVIGSGVNASGYAGVGNSECPAHVYGGFS